MIDSRGSAPVPTPIFGATTGVIADVSYSSPPNHAPVPTPIFGATTGVIADVSYSSPPNHAPVPTPIFGATTGGLPLQNGNILDKTCSILLTIMLMIQQYIQFC